MNIAENPQFGEINACSMGCPVFIPSPEQAGMALEAQVLPIQGGESLSDKQRGIISLVETIRAGLSLQYQRAAEELGELINKYKRSGNIPPRDRADEFSIRVQPTGAGETLDPKGLSEPLVRVIGKDLDVPPFLRREYVYHPEQRLMELKRGSFPWRKALAVGLLTALALWALSKGSPFIRQPDRESNGQVTTTQLYLSPDAVVGGYIPAGSDELIQPQESPSTNFINRRVIVEPGDNVWSIVKRGIDTGWVNSANGVERADAVAGIVVELMLKQGLNPNQLRVGQEFSIADYIQFEAEKDLMETAVSSGSLEQYQLNVAPAVRKLFIP